MYVLWWGAGWLAGYLHLWLKRVEERKGWERQRKRERANILGCAMGRS